MLCFSVSFFCVWNAAVQCCRWRCTNSCGIVIVPFYKFEFGLSLSRLQRGGFRHDQHVRLYRGPTKRGPHRPENVGQQRDISCLLNSRDVFVHSCQKIGARAVAFYWTEQGLFGFKSDSTLATICGNTWYIRLKFCCCYIYIVSQKRDPDIIDCNFKKD